MFLSNELMGRPFCNAEQRWAIQYGCQLVGVVEKDSRHNPADFDREKGEWAPLMVYLFLHAPGYDLFLHTPCCKLHSVYTWVYLSREVGVYNGERLW